MNLAFFCPFVPFLGKLSEAHLTMVMALLDSDLIDTQMLILSEKLSRRNPLTGFLVPTELEIYPHIAPVLVPTGGSSGRLSR